MKELKHIPRCVKHKSWVSNAGSLVLEAMPLPRYHQYITQGIFIAPLDTELLIQSFCIKSVPALLSPRSMNKAVLKRLSWDFSGGPVVRLHVSNAGA